MAISAEDTSASILPRGVWHVDPDAGTLSFKSRGLFGLVPVTGTFGSYDGSLTVDPHGASGELRIDAASLDTKNAKRDEHLRSEDFFDVANAPTIRFTLTSVEASETGQARLMGTLQIRQTRMHVAGPVTITLLDGDRLALAMTLSVDRTAAGVGWSKMGMVQGKAHLTASLELLRMDVD